LEWRKTRAVYDRARKKELFQVDVTSPKALGRSHFMSSAFADSAWCREFQDKYVSCVTVGTIPVRCWPT